MFEVTCLCGCNVCVSCLELLLFAAMNYAERGWDRLPRDVVKSFFYGPDNIDGAGTHLAMVLLNKYKF